MSIFITEEGLADVPSTDLHRTGKRCTNMDRGLESATPLPPFALFLWLLILAALSLFCVCDLSKKSNILILLLSDYISDFKYT